MKKLKILHLLQSSHFSGAENVVCQIIDMFKDHNIEMAYCSRDGQIREVLKENNISFHPIKKLCINEVRQVIAKYHPDIIHAHDTRASIISSFVAKNIRIISHMHVNHENMNKVNFKTLLYLMCSIQFKHIFWVSNSAFNNYLYNKQILSKSSILYNVINREAIINKAKKDNNYYTYDIVYIGRLTYQKNPERLMYILKLAIEMNSKIKVAIIGTGDLFEAAKKLSVELGIEKNISFLGFISNPYKILHDAKVMLMTSRFEGTPMCALEAIALGVPIVCTPTDGLKDIITNDINGYMSNDDKVISEKIVKIVLDEKLYERLSRCAIEGFIDMNNLNQYKQNLLKEYV